MVKPSKILKQTLQPVEKAIKQEVKFATKMVDRATKAVLTKQHNNKKGKTQRRSAIQRSADTNLPGNFALSDTQSHINTTKTRQRFKLMSEKIGDMTSSTGVNIQTFQLTPINNLICPIFHNVAKNWQKYRVIKSWIEFRTEAYQVSNTLSAGKIVMAACSDADSNSFTTDTQLEMLDGSVTGPPFAKNLRLNTLYGLKNNQEYYMDANNNSDLRTSEYGVLYVGTFSNSSNGSVIGELWHHHEYELIGITATPVNIPTSPSLYCAAASGLSTTNLFGVLYSQVFAFWTNPFPEFNGGSVVLLDNYFRVFVNTIAFPDLPNTYSYTVRLEVTGTGLVSTAGMGNGNSLVAASGTTFVNTYLNNTAYAMYYASPTVVVIEATITATSTNVISSGNITFVALNTLFAGGATIATVNVAAYSTAFNAVNVGLSKSEKKILSLLGKDEILAPKTKVLDPRIKLSSRSVAPPNTPVPLYDSLSSSSHSESSSSSSSNNPKMCCLKIDEDGCYIDKIRDCEGMAKPMHNLGWRPIRMD